MDVAVDGTWVGYGVGVAGVPGGVSPVFAGVLDGVAPVVTGVDAGRGVPGGCPGRGPISNPHSVPALARSSKSPSCAALIAVAISPGPPTASIRHCIPSRSS